MTKLSKTALAVLLGAVSGYCIALIKTSPTVAYAQAGPPAPTPFMCSNGGGVPGGYVVVNVTATNNCIAPDGTHGFMYQLLKLKPDPNGTMSAVICTGTPVPGGFVTTGWNQNPTLCLVPGGIQYNQQSIATFN